MKIIFVDAENTGLKGLQTVKATILDKVFVYSKNEAIQQYSKKALFCIVDDYPTGSNQADFLIISYLSRIISTLDEAILNTTHFELFSNDEGLISAFESISKSLGARHRVIRTKIKSEEAEVDDDKELLQSLSEYALMKIEAMEEGKDIVSIEQVNAEKKIYKALSTPAPLDDLFRQKVKLSKSLFTKAINELILTRRILRSEDNKKHWMQAS